MWITRVAINNPVFAAMVMVALCVLGLFSYGKLGVEQMPDISFPGAWLEVRYPGASPEAVERELIKPLEEAINSVAGVKRITSRSGEGQGAMSVEFSLDTDMNRAMQEVRDRVSAAQSGFPRDAKQPTIARFNNDNNEPVVNMALVGRCPATGPAASAPAAETSAACVPKRSARELSILGDQIVGKRLQRVEGVARVDIQGLTVREVRIDLDPVRLRAYGVTPAEISAALAQANADQPVGLVSDNMQDALLRVEGRVRDPRQFEQIVVARRGDLSLRLADLGTLVEREREAESYARINGQAGINFNVFKQQDANIVAVGEAVQKAMEEIRKTLPPDVELRLINASSDFAKDSLNGVRHTLIEGALLTVAIVFLFLHSWRSTIITGLTLPIAVISSFIAVYAFGFTLNFMTMMALSLCIGLLIDDSIVVRENIVRHLAMGKDHHTAANDGTNEIGLAVMATTFAICAVFVPVAFMGGIIGKFFYPFGITVVVAVLVSLFVSFTLDPMLSSIWPDPPAVRLRRMPVIGHAIRATDATLDKLHDVYGRVIHWIFSERRWRLGVSRLWLGIPVYAHGFDQHQRRDKSSPRHWRLATITPRGVVIAIGTLSFVVALGLAPLVGSEFVPQTDQGFTQLALRMPVGSSLERTNVKVRQVEEIIGTLPEIANIATWVGGAGQRNQAWLNISLKPRKDRQRSQKQVEDAMRELVARVPGTDAAVGFNRPIYVAILGSDPEGLARVADDFAEKVKKIPGAVDVESSVKQGLPAYAVRLKPSAVRELGITAQQLASSLRAYVNGETATYWTTPDGDQVDVVLRLNQVQRERVEQLRALPVAFAKDGSPISLDSVATIETVFNPEIIRRQNLQRREAVFAGVQGRSAGEVGDDVQKLIKEATLPPGYSFDVGGQMQQQAEAFNGLLAAMALAVIFIYIVLASQFGSFLQPIAIMASLPLALIGVMLALLLWRSTLNIFSMIGLVMLMGLVTKNAILLVDFANHARKAGASVAEALLQAGLIRMRPIIMTTMAMVFGMLPLALAFNEGGEIQAPMGRAIIGGIITSTLLTLVVVPVLYSYLAREKKPAPAADATPVASGGAPGPLPMPADRD